MSVKTYRIALPPDGLLLRDFAVTALAHVAYYAGDAMRLSMDPMGAEITFPSHNAPEVARAFQRFFEEAVKRAESLPGRRPRLVGNDWGKTIPKWVELISDKAGVEPPRGERWGLVCECMKVYSNWIGGEIAYLDELLTSLSIYESGKDLLIKWGSGASSNSPEALSLFKANYYAGRRGMTAKFRTGLDAKVKLDVHTLTLSLAGAIMAKQGVFKPGEQNLAVYLSLLDPGAMGLRDELSKFVDKVRYRTAPDVVFRLASAMTAHSGGAGFGIQPVRLITVAEGGQRTNVVSTLELELDQPLFHFLEVLASKSPWAYQGLRNLMEYTLNQWEERSREGRTIVEVGHMLAQAIVLSCSHSLSPEEALYSVSRASYASASHEFDEALRKHKKLGFDLKGLALLVKSVYTALKGAVSSVS